MSALNPEVASYVSVLAGRIADTGVDPVPLMAAAVQLLETCPKAELIWASPREVLNIFHADSIGCHVITATQRHTEKAAARRVTTWTSIPSIPCECSIATPSRRDCPRANERLAAAGSELCG